MYQIDVSSAVANMPNPAAAGAPGFFSDGDPVGGQAGTIVPAEFLNTLMMELLNLLVAGQVAPSKADRTQVTAAIKALTTGSLTPKGFVAVPVGKLTLILNWGNDTHGDNSGAQVVTFAKPFANTTLCSFASNAAGGPPVAFHGTGNNLNDRMTVFSAVSSNTPAGAGTAVRWFAIGF